MNSDPGERLQDLLAEALERAPRERAAFLAQACGGDETLRAEAWSLLGHGPGAREFLEEPAYAGVDAGAGSLRPGDRLGECRVLALLGEGGMGEVYLAQDTRLERQVAVKLLKRRLGDESLHRRFRHERRVLAGLTHPNIARLYDGATTPEGRPYLVLEYVEGERLDHFCDSHRLGVDARLALFRQVCAAVNYAHQNLVVHRDLKPANIRVTPAGEPKLLDFGIAKLIEPEGALPADPALTLTGAMTPGYASPEQLRGEPITTSSDVYSLGVVLYELLCGQRPFQARDRRPGDLARAICEEEPPRPSTVAGRPPPTTHPATVPPGQPLPTTREAPARLRRLLEGDLDNIVAMALRKEPARRYASVAAFAEDLRRHGEGLPVSARQDTLPYRAGKFVRRNKTAVAAAAVVVLALVGGLLASTWQAQLARQERDRARLAQNSAELARQQADRLNRFLEELLSSADPARMGKDVKVVQVLDAAGRSLDAELANEPRILAQVHETLGRAYGRLQINQPAVQHAQAALDLVRRLDGPESPATAEAEYQLGSLLYRFFQFNQAEPLLRHALAIQRRQTPPDPATLAETLRAFGEGCARARRVDEAKPLLEESLALTRAVSGERSLNYAHVLYTLAYTKHMATEVAAMQNRPADLEGTIADYRRVVELYNQLSPRNPQTLIAGFNTCICLGRERKFDQAEKELDEFDVNCRQILGEDNNYHDNSLALHAILDFRKGDYAKVLTESQHPLDLFIATQPANNRNVVQLRGIRGLALTRVGRAAEGEPFLRAAYADGVKTERFPFEFTFGNVESALGECLLTQGRLAEAEPLLLAGYDELKTRLGAPHPATLGTEHLLHDLYAAWHRPDQAARFAGRATSPPDPNR